MPELLRIGGLWRSTDKNGNATLTGNLNATTRVLIFANTFKAKDTEPDYVLYFAAKEEPNTSDAPAPLDAQPVRQAEPDRPAQRPTRQPSRQPARREPDTWENDPFNEDA